MKCNTVLVIKTTVKIGYIEIEGLMFPDGSYGISIPQVCTLFGIPQKNVSRDFKALLGNDLVFLKAKDESQKQTYNALNLDQFLLLTKLLATKGKQGAINLLIDLAGLSLVQLFSDAFGIKFEEEDRQRYLKFRQSHREDYHPLFTKWGKFDGIPQEEGWRYASRLNSFKSYLGLPKIPVDQYDADQIEALTRAYIRYDCYRNAGYSHQQAVLSL